MIRLASTVALTLAAGATGAIQFSGTSTLNAAQRPAGVASADFNGDGLADLAVAVDNIDRITVFFGTGSGAFAPGFDIFTGSGSGPDAMEAVDADGDGDADLAVVLKGINQFRVYTNAGGNFVAGGSVPTGDRPVSLTVADLDGVGGPDFAMANRDANTATIVLNNGGLSATTIATGAEPRDVAAGDFDGNGTTDLAVTNHDSRSISVFSGSGAGTFTPTATLSTGGQLRPEGIVAGDFNGDGAADLAATVSDDGLNLVAVYTNTGGAFGGFVTYAVNGVEPGDIAAADLDNDGDLDLVTANEESASVSMLENTGAGFAAGMAVAAGIEPDWLELADLDNNGSIDVAVSNTTSNTVSLFFNAAAAGPCNPADFAEPFGTLNIDDVIAYLDAFALGSPSADLAADGTLNIDDVLAFVNAFAAGCP